VNDRYKELKTRIRDLQNLLEVRGMAANRDLAQAVSAVKRAERRGDRSRDPSPELRGLLEKAEALARTNMAS
jgi:hypothetical protein